MDTKKSPFKATKLWNQLISSFIEGMELKRRRFRFKSYEQCFSGADALEWMHRYLQNHPSYGDNVTKEQAFMLLQKFLENKVFECVTGKSSLSKFEDSNCLYKFNQDEKNEKGETITIPSQKSITNLLNKVQKDLAEQEPSDKKEIETSATKTYALFEPSDEENIDTATNLSFFSRSNSLRIGRKPLASLTNSAMEKRTACKSIKSIKKDSTMKVSSTKNNPPMKRSLNDKFGLTDIKKRKHTITTECGNKDTKLPMKSTRLFKSAKKVLLKSEHEKSYANFENMEISPIKTIYKSTDIIQHFSPSPIRRRASPIRKRLRKSKSSDLHKFKSRSHHDLAFGTNGQGLYKASSSWDLNKLESANPNHFMLSKDKLSPEEMEQTWKSVVLLSLRKLLRMEHVSEYIDQYQISGKTIMQNMECNESQVKETVPDWLLSAMDCLIKWPQFNNDYVEGDLPKYAGFHCDVFQAIKEHYHTLSNEPLIPCHLTSLLEECMEYVDDDMSVTVQTLQHIMLVVDNGKRCQLQTLINFMKKISENTQLNISKDLSNKDLMVHSFFRIISRKDNHFLNNQTEVLGIRVAYFLIHHYDEIFKAPNSLRVQVDHKIAVIYGNLRQTKESTTVTTTATSSQRPSSADTDCRRSRVAYCKQITKQEYQKEAVDFSRQEIRNLLQSIISDRSLSSKEVSRRLKQFRKAYPDIYESAVKGHKIFSETNEL